MIDIYKSVGVLRDSPNRNLLNNWIKDKLNNGELFITDVGKYYNKQEHRYVYRIKGVMKDNIEDILIGLE